MRTKLLGVAAATALLAAMTPQAAQATHSWAGYHWARTANPFTIKLGDNVSGAAWDAALASASADWTASAVLDTPIVPGSAKRNCRATAGMVQVCNAAYGNTGWLGIASISVTGGTHITQGTVKLNDTYFNTVQYNTPEWRNLVTCQEVGHTLGLDHQDEVFDNTNLFTCMDYTNDPSTNQKPNQHDYDELVTIYTHLDSTSTVGLAAPQGAPQVGNDASTWGREAAGSRSSGESTFVRDFGDGNLVITFVTWA